MSWEDWIWFRFVDVTLQTQPSMHWYKMGTLVVVTEWAGRSWLVVLLLLSFDSRDWVRLRRQSRQEGRPFGINYEIEFEEAFLCSMFTWKGSLERKEKSIQTPPECLFSFLARTVFEEYRLENKSSNRTRFSASTSTEPLLLQESRQQNMNTIRYEI